MVFYVFVGMVMLAPMPFGMVYEVFQAFFAVVFFLLVGLYCVVQRKPDVGLGKIWPECVGFGIVVVWAVFQIVPLLPAAWHHPLWVEAGTVLGRDLMGSITLTRGGGFESLMRLVMYGAVFWLALQLGRNRKRAQMLVWAVVAAATAYAIYGLVMYFGDFGLILWVEAEGRAGNVTGTFINRNNFATYMGLGVLCAAGLYLDGFFKAFQSRRMGRDRKLHLLQQAFVHGAPLLACVIVMLTALFLTNSRAGVVCSVIALIVLVMFMGPLGRMHSRLYRLLTVSVLVVVLGIFFQSGEGWLDRLTATEMERETRLKRYEQTWAAIGHAPLSGYGLGSFEATFPIYADEQTVTSFKAHNDWLEMMFELGVPVAVVWFAVLGGLGVRCLVGFFRRRRDHVYPVVGFCACILVGLHALVDFSLQIPAVAITFAVLLGVGVAQGWRSEG